MESWRRLTVGLGAMLAAVVFVSAAVSAPPEKIEFSNVAFSNVLSDVCAFDVNIDQVASGFQINYFDEDGNIVRIEIHQVEQDTFTANGKTLTGLPYAFSFSLLFDSDGNVTNAIARGITEKILLPDGSLFVGAGWVDFIDHPGVFALVSPDRGNPGNVAGFCAALAP